MAVRRSESDATTRRRGQSQPGIPRLVPTTQGRHTDVAPQPARMTPAAGPSIFAKQRSMQTPEAPRIEQLSGVPSTIAAGAQTRSLLHVSWSRSSRASSVTPSRVKQTPEPWQHDACFARGPPLQSSA